MARKKSTKKQAPVTGAERQRLHRERLADAGHRTVSMILPGSVIQRLDSEAERRGISRTALMKEKLSQSKAPTATPRPAASPSGGEAIGNAKRFRRACKAVLALRDETPWRTTRTDSRKRGTVFRDAIARLATDLRAALPSGSEWDDLHEKL